MNILKKSSAILMGAALMVGVSSCTGEFEKINTNPLDIPNENVSMGDLFNEAQQAIFFNTGNTDYQYQLIQNLNADLYSGYCAIPTAFNGGNNNDNYFMMKGWGSENLNMYLLHVIKPCVNLENNETLAADFVAIAKILKVAGAQKMVDTYGPCPYLEAMQGGMSVNYDSEEAIYKSFFEDLSSAISALTTWLDANGGNDDAGRLAWDNMCGKSQKTWLQFANTLRLRLAVRCAMADPSTAKTQAEAAVANKYGLLKTVDVEVKNDVLKNPQIVCARDYNDCAISANYETILKGYNDPRLEKTVLPVGWADRNKGDIKDANGENAGLVGKIKGIRNGMVVDGNQYKMYSIPMPAANFDPSSCTYGTPYCNLLPLPIMNRAEASFLQAEGALRGWTMGGTAQSFYEEGIKNSFAKYGLNATEYLAGTTTQIDYVDPHNPANNIAAVNNVPVKFMTEGSKEEQLQQIITQKWIAGFPEGLNAWAEYRRTGYPKLFPIPASNCAVQVEFLSGSEADLIANGPRRLPFADSEHNNNPAGLATGVAILSARGQKDAVDARLWWDTGKNF